MDTLTLSQVGGWLFYAGTLVFVLTMVLMLINLHRVVGRDVFSIATDLGALCIYLGACLLISPWLLIIVPVLIYVNKKL